MINNIRKLLSTLDSHIPWVMEFMELATEDGVEQSSSTPGKASAKDVLNDAKIHKLTTANSGINSIGFDELIKNVSDIPSSDTVLITGLIGSKKRGVLYHTIDGHVLGGVVVSRQL